MAFTGFASRYREPRVEEGFEDITKVDFKVRDSSADLRTTDVATTDSARSSKAQRSRERCGGDTGSRDRESTPSHHETAAAPSPTPSFHLSPITGTHDRQTLPLAPLGHSTSHTRASALPVHDPRYRASVLYTSESYRESPLAGPMGTASACCVGAPVVLSKCGCGGGRSHALQAGDATWLSGPMRIERDA